MNAILVFNMKNEITSDNPKNNPFTRWQSVLSEDSINDLHLNDSKESVNIKEDLPVDNIDRTLNSLLNQELQHIGDATFRPNAEIKCGRDQLQDQRINVVYEKDKNLLSFYSKLRPKNALMKKMETWDVQTEKATLGGTRLDDDEFVYSSASSKEEYKLCDAFVFTKNGARVFIADPTSMATMRKYEDYFGFRPELITRAAIGLVKIEMPDDIGINTVKQLLVDVFEKDFGIKDVFSNVSEESEREFKTNYYEWHHKIDARLTQKQAKAVEDLQNKEVSLNYTTFIDRNKHKKYLKMSGEDLRSYHEFSSGSIMGIYRALGLGFFSTSERFSRGLIAKGASSTDDFISGGADSVFTRIANTTQINRMGQDEVIAVFKPELWDRTDWYAYPDDQYGTTSGDTYINRLSPEELFSLIAKNNKEFEDNEQMFRIGIGPNYIEHIVVPLDERNRIINGIKSLGMTSVDGRQIEDIIVSQLSTT